MRSVVQAICMWGWGLDMAVRLLLQISWASCRLRARASLMSAQRTMPWGGANTSKLKQSFAVRIGFGTGRHAGRTSVAFTLYRSS